MISNILAFQNHDINKVIIHNPILFNVELLVIFGILLFIPNKKEKKGETFLYRNFTNEVKGVAILLIIIHHLCRHTVSKPTDLILFYNMGYVGVALFLILSGYGLTKSFVDKGSNNFFARKLIRIYIPFIFLNLTWLILDYYLLNVKRGISASISILSGMKIVDRNYWYIPFLIFWYIVFYFIMNIKIDSKYKVLILLLLSIVILMNPISGSWSTNAFSFPFGVIIALYKDKINDLYKKLTDTKKSTIKNIFICGILMSGFYLSSGIASRFHMLKIVGMLYIIAIFVIYYCLKKTTILEKGALMILLFISTTKFSANEEFIYNLSISLFSLFSAFFVILILDFINKGKVSVFFKFLGKISFEMYLIHGALMYSYDFILYKFPIQISFIIYITTIILISTVLNKLYNRISKRIIGYFQC